MSPESQLHRLTPAELKAVSPAVQELNAAMSLEPEPSLQALQYLVDRVTRQISNALRDALRYSEEEQLRVLRLVFANSPYEIHFSPIPTDITKLS